MIIRTLKKADLPELLVLIKGMIDYHSAVDKYYKPFSEYRGLAQEAESWLENKNMLTIVAEDSGRLIAYGQFAVEEAPTYVAVKKIGIVYDVFVEKTYRRRKIAEEIMKRALGWFQKKKVGNIELNIDARNEIGIKFWKKIGFFEYKQRMRLDFR